MPAGPRGAGYATALRGPAGMPLALRLSEGLGHTACVDGNVDSNIATRHCLVDWFRSRILAAADSETTMRVFMYVSILSTKALLGPDFQSLEL